MKTKIATICVAVLLASVGLASFAMASDVVEVTGTFTASGTLSISVNNTSPDFGTITPGENEVVWFNVSNIGDIPVTVTQKQANKENILSRYRSVVKATGSASVVQRKR